MVATSHDSMTVKETVAGKHAVGASRALGSVTQGHVALYAHDARWRRSMIRSLKEAGHSYAEAASPAEIRKLLLSQSFDVLTLKIRNEADARDIAQALDGVTVPLHGILVGNPSAVPLTLQARRRGTFRYVPGPLPAKELSRLIDVSISAGAWEENTAENGNDAHIQEVDLEEIIENAAAMVYSRAKRKRQRFATVVEGPSHRALADPVRLRRTLTTLLRLIIGIAPHGALVSVEARASRDEWTVQLRASRGKKGVDSAELLAETLQEETKTLTAVSRDVRLQGGMFWVELLGPSALALCLTLALPADDAESTK